MFHTYLTFTVAIPIQTWMGSGSEASTSLFMSFLDDLASELEIVSTVTSCLIVGKQEIWYTFLSEDDKNLFMAQIEKLWREGWWLANG